MLSLISNQITALNVSACTLCNSCQCVCPVKIDLGDQIYKWRQKLQEYGTASKGKKMMCDAMSRTFLSAALYDAATGSAHLLNKMPHALVHCGLNPWAEGHEMMEFPRKPFHKLFKELENTEDS